jgi:hypothetical protein
MAEGFLIRKGGGGFNFPNSVIRDAFVAYNAATVNAGNLITNTIDNAVFNTVNISTSNIFRRKLIKINDTKFVYFYTDGSYIVRARIVTVNTNKTLSFGTELTFTGFSSTYFFDAILMPDGRIFVIGINWSTAYSWFSIVTPNISTNTLTSTVAPTENTAIRFSQETHTSIGLALTEEGQVLLTYTDQSTAHPSAILINVLTSSITVGSRFAINTTFGSNHHTISKIGNENKFLVTFRNTSTAQPFMLILVVTGGNTITMGTSYVVNSISCGSVRHLVYDPVNIFIGYFNQSTSPVQHTLAYVTVSGADLTVRQNTNLNHSWSGGTPADLQYNLVISRMSSNRLAVVYGQRDTSSNAGLGYNILTFTQNSSWSTLVFRNINSNGNSNQYGNLDYIPINGNNGFVVQNASSSTGNQDFYTFVYDIGKNTISNTAGHTSIRGVAKDTALSDQPLQIYTVGINI